MKIIAHTKELIVLTYSFKNEERILDGIVKTIPETDFTYSATYSNYNGPDDTIMVLTEFPIEKLDAILEYLEANKEL
jgi:hypothetical protein